MTMITPSYLGETIEYSSLHACRSTLEDPAKGENAGKRLHHVAVLRSIQKLGSVKRSADFSRAVELPRAAAGQRMVVFLQESGPGRIIGASVLLP